jgi:hypothetical protein
MRKRIIIIALFLSVAFAAVYFFLLRMPINNPEIINNAIPNKAAFIIRLNDPLTFFNNIGENIMWQSLGEHEMVKQINKTAETVKAAIINDASLQSALSGIPTYFSVLESDENKTTTLAILQLNEKAKYDLLEKAVTRYCEKSNIEIKKSRKNNSRIIEFQNPAIPNQQLLFVNYKGLLFIGNDQTSIETSIEQIKSGHECDQQFISLMKTASIQAVANIFINHANLNPFFFDGLSNQYRTKTELLKSHAQWSELDLQFIDNSILFGGFSVTNDELNFFGNVLIHQEPVQSTIDQILPSSTLSFLAFNFSDITDFFNRYANFLDSQNKADQQKRELKAMQLSTSTDIVQLFQDLMDKETATCTIPFDNDSNGFADIWLVKTKSGSQAYDKINKLQKDYLTSRKIMTTDWEEEYKIDNQTSYSLLKFPFPQLPSLLFGELFQLDANWVTVSENYLVFGQSVEAVSQFVKSSLQQTLQRNNEFQKFKSDLSQKSNIHFYCNISELGKLANRALNNKTFEIFDKSTELKKFRYFAWQVSSSGNMLYNNAILNFNPEKKIKSRTIWQSKLNDELKMAPLFVRNPSDPQNKDLIFQDESNIVYLTNNIGRTIWQIELEDKILGNIQPIDYFKNGKIQFLFNTENKIYLIDREGNNIQNFPINLRSKATNGVSIFDYDNNKNYRFFIACADKNIYAYDENGKILDGWKTYKTDHVVNQPIQHMRLEGKDYIVASDQMKDYFLNRKGEIRIETTAIFQHSHNNTIYMEERSKVNEPRFVTTDDTGKLHYTYLDGKHEESSFINASASHFFIADDLSPAPGIEYLFADGENITLLNSKGEQLLTKTFESPINYLPTIFQVGKQKMFGVTLSLENKIYMFDLMGQIQKGFPYEGCSPFDLSPSENAGYNIAVGGKDSYLNYYFCN